MSIKSSVSFYPCRDINKTNVFYHDVLELPIYSDQGKAKIYDTGYGYWGFVQYDDSTPNPSRLCLSLNCEDNNDVDKFYKIITQKGLTPLDVPKQHEKFPVYSFFIKDPDGYLVEFQKINA